MNNALTVSRRGFGLGAAAFGLLLVSGCSRGSSSEGGGLGSGSGKLTLAPMGDGVHISGEVGGLPANAQSGFHVHEKGDCSAVDATSAGAHFNPAASQHGRAGTATHHAGDMDNLVSDASGVAKVNMHLRGVTLGGGAANDIAGRAVIVHAAPDDYRTQPTGNAGARVACGVIKVTR